MLNIKFDIIFQNDHADQLTNGVEGLAMDDIFQLHHGENNLIFNEMRMRSALY
jgi:hypothetical protein